MVLKVLLILKLNVLMIFDIAITRLKDIEIGSISQDMNLQKLV